MRRLLMILTGVGAAALAWFGLREMTGQPRPALRTRPRPRRDPERSEPRSAAGSTASRSGTETVRCRAETRTGKRCSRDAEPGSSYCWQHR